MIVTIILAVFTLVHIFFLISYLRKKFSVIDIAWGLGILLPVVISYLYQGGHVLKNHLLLGVVALWSLRLTLYILIRSWGGPEDRRYAQLREEWKPHSELHAYFKIFLFQGFLMLVVSLPGSTGMKVHDEMSVLNWLGLVIFITGFALEIWSDSFLSRWKKNPAHKGEICTSGPWKLCRFPNYFGEVLLWYGVYFLAFSSSNFWSIIGPIVLNFMILKVTGVPMLEEKYMKRQDYREYAKKVPRFIPFTKAS